jgi:two-component system sensor histidine kinase QseC
MALGVVAGAVLVLSVSFLVLHLVIRNELFRNLDEGMRGQMTAIAEYVAANPGRERVSEFLPQFRTRAHQDFFQVWDGAGRTLARSDSSAGRDLPLLRAVVGVATYHDLVLPDGHHGRAVSQAFELAPDDARQRLTVVVAEEVENLESFENRIHRLLLAIAVGTAIAMLLIARLAVLRGLGPVASFARSVESVNPEDPQARLETGPLPSELQPVAGSFSRLLDRLLDALARERRYARNVAHELRNPLAEIRLLADVGSADHDPDAAQAAIRDIGSAAAEMERIVDALMALTRYEAGLESPQPEPINLAAELRREVRRQAVAAEQRGLEIVQDLPTEAWVHTDSALAHRLLANLLGNAVSHSPRGATVHVAMSVNGDLSLANPAPHLSPADLPRLRERFYHIDTGEKGTHAGLGLSLADAIARVLGLTIRLGLQEDGCLVAEVHGFRALETATASHELPEPP